MTQLTKPKVAIVGSGITGLVCAYKLHQDYDIQVFEANDHIGGHTHTVDIQHKGDSQSIDTGFIVFNTWTYPNFIQLIDEIGVPWKETAMSFSVKCEKSGLEYNGTSLSGIFSQKRNLITPGFWNMLREIVVFGDKARELIQLKDNISVNDFLKREGFGKRFIEHYFIPMGASIWSCPPDTFGAFPMRFIAEFYENHGMLNIQDRPVWRVIDGGSSAYLKPLTKNFSNRIRTSTPITRIYRKDQKVHLHTPTSVETYDYVIMATHADQSLNMVTDLNELERESLSAFPYQKNQVTLHTDTNIMPETHMAWASWNYRIKKSGERKATLTYNMTMLQKLNTPHTYLVSLNSDDDIDESKVIRRFSYEHPVFQAQLYQSRDHLKSHAFDNLIGFGGAWMGNGFHEDGVSSALNLCKKLNEVLNV